MATNERLAMGALRAKAFLGASLAGGCAGVAAAGFSGANYIMLAATGILLVLLAGNIGGFAGALVRGTVRWARKESPDRDGFSPEGVLVLSAYGGFLGIVVALVAGGGHLAHLYSAAGAMAGGCIASLWGNHVFILVRLMILSELDDASRAKAIRRAAAHSRSELLPPDDESWTDLPPTER